MKPPQQIAEEAWKEIKNYDNGIIGKQSPRIDAFCINVIKSVIKEATVEHQKEHDRLQKIIERDTMKLMAEKEKSRVLGNLVEGFRKQLQSRAASDQPEPCDGVCTCGHLALQHFRYSDHDKCQECECDRVVIYKHNDATMSQTKEPK